MATTVMAMVKNRGVLLLPLIFSSYSILAGEWSFTPSVGASETYSDNVKLSTINQQESFVTQAIAGLQTAYHSRLAEFTFSGKGNYVTYSHNSKLNDGYRSLDTAGKFSLWTSGPRFVFDAKIANVSKNGANNSLADLVSGDTVEEQTYSAGFEYELGNSDYNIASSINYQLRTADDNIGESKGYSATFNSENGSSARNIFWRINASYSNREQQSSQNIQTSVPDAEQYIIETIVGVITPYNFNPFVRYYDEDIKGTSANNNTSLTSSWGPGIRWLVSDHLFFDLSYNYVEDDTVSDDYFAAKISWQPSTRTTLETSYSKRFFGDSYSFDLQHKTKRLLNSISYNETLQVFDRNNYNRIDLGVFWCPSADFTGEASQCFVSNTPVDDYQLVTLSNLELEQSKGFSINKTLAWSTTLQLSRTKFTFTASGNEREELDTGSIDDYINAELAISRSLSPNSNIELSGKFRHQQFDKNSLGGARQNDYYRTASIKYDRKLASSLTSDFSLGYLNRSSNLDRFSYQELRVIINIKKEF